MKKSIIMKNSKLQRMFIPLAVAIVTLASSLTACNSDSTDGPDLPAYSNIVTVRSIVPGMGSTFTYRAGETTPIITLTSTYTQFNEQLGIKEGKRMLIYYNLPEGRQPNTDGPIDLQIYGAVYNDTIRTATPEIINSWGAASMQQTQVWRTGNYINAFSIMPLVNDVKLCLYADLESINGESVDLYLTLNNNTLTPSQVSGQYASYHLADFLIKHPEITNFNIHLAGGDGHNAVTISNVHYLPGE